MEPDGIKWGPYDRARFQALRASLRQEWQPRVGVESALVDMLNTRLMSGQMPAAMRTTIISRITSISVSQGDPNPGLLSRMRVAIHLIIASPQFNIER